MDDSEKTYGYSNDIYHGRRGPGGHYGATGGPHHEASYEYSDRGRGPGWSGLPHESDYSPEADAVRTTFGPPYQGNRDDLRGPFRGIGPRNYARRNERILEDVCDRLQHHAAVDASGFEVLVEEGEVTLVGSVPSRRMKKLAEAVSEEVVGVRDVHNRLRIGPPSEGDGDSASASSEDGS